MSENQRSIHLMEPFSPENKGQLVLSSDPDADLSIERDSESYTLNGLSIARLRGLPLGEIVGYINNDTGKGWSAIKTIQTMGQFPGEVFELQVIISEGELPLVFEVSAYDVRSLD